MIKKFLYIEKTKSKGRGVFTKEKINAGTVIEESPVIVMTASDRINIDKTLLHDYIFAWGEKKDQCCMAFRLVTSLQPQLHQQLRIFYEF